MAPSKRFNGGIFGNTVGSDTNAASISGIFSISLTMLGERYSASQVAGATAILVMVFEVGSLTGPLIGGRVMDIVGPMGFIYTITSFTFIFLVISIYRTFRR